jgi:hypothetical protein
MSLDCLGYGLGAGALALRVEMEITSEAIAIQGKFTTDHDRDFLRVATESLNIFLYPLKSNLLVHKSEILATWEKLLGTRETKHIGAIVYSHHDDILVLCKARLRRLMVRHWAKQRAAIISHPIIGWDRGRAESETSAVYFGPCQKFLNA